jgi:hypothetical protein
MEELFYKNLFYIVKDMLHNPQYRSILINKDNQILNFLTLAIEESWRVWMDSKYNVPEEDK